MMNLLLLAPDIQEQILFAESVDGVEPISDSALRAVAYAENWAKQRAAPSSIWVAVADRCGHALVGSAERDHRPGARPALADRRPSATGCQCRCARRLRLGVIDMLSCCASRSTWSLAWEGCWSHSSAALFPGSWQ